MRFDERCHAYTEDPERAWVLCELRYGHEGKHRAGDIEWDDEANEVEAELRELLRRAEQAAGEEYE
ncbi:hypothetical protein [Myxococcus virescens]|uniref:Uncharacterized protein n=1 Tax=Myxococcus virescens TaxID=83456 RepID=A0ABY0MV52_9BACT|nr:hypothetical protein [Myxococcus virescens]SDE53540.1 hypothetical protein SAMN04488504_10899 [Myxococcus virescens]